MTERNIGIETDSEPISERGWEKAYLVANGVWKERRLLPVTHDSDYDRISEVSPLVIPLVGGGHIELGKFSTTPTKEETVYIEVNTGNKDGKKINSFGTNLTSMYSSGSEEASAYDFWIFFDDPHDSDQVKIVKYLAGFNPIKKIDWDSIKPKTNEMDIALSISQMVFEAHCKRKK